MALIDDLMRQHGDRMESRNELDRSSMPVPPRYSQMPGQATPGTTQQQRQTPFGTATVNPDGTPELFQPGLVPFSASQSGIDFSDPFIAGITEQLSNYGSNMEGNIQAGTDNALALSESQGRGMLEGELTTTINSLANRGILGSTEAERVLKGVGSNAVEGSRQAGLTAGLNQANQNMQAPNILSQMAALGQKSTSLQADPLAPYRLSSDFISNQS